MMRTISVTDTCLHLNNFIDGLAPAYIFFDYIVDRTEKKVIKSTIIQLFWKVGQSIITVLMIGMNKLIKYYFDIW
jgi:hypothetical protein